MSPREAQGASLPCTLFPTSRGLCSLPLAAASWTPRPPSGQTQRPSFALTGRSRSAVSKVTSLPSWKRCTLSLMSLSSSSFHMSPRAFSTCCLLKTETSRASAGGFFARWSSECQAPKGTGGGVVLWRGLQPSPYRCVKLTTKYSECSMAPWQLSPLHSASSLTQASISSGCRSNNSCWALCMILLLETDSPQSGRNDLLEA